MAIRCGWIAVIAATVAACASMRRPLPAPVFSQGIWHIRIDVDSAPSRRKYDKPVFGTIDFANARYAIDFWTSINHRIPYGAHVVSVPANGERPSQFKMTLGDTSSFDEKIVFVGHQVARDSVVGTWTETIVCCSAAGRFSLWRSRRE